MWRDAGLAHFKVCRTLHTFYGFAFVRAKYTKYFTRVGTTVFMVQHYLVGRGDRVHYGVRRHPPPPSLRMQNFAHAYDQHVSKLSDYAAYALP